jgi:hypothetical protein
MESSKLIAGVKRYSYLLNVLLIHCLDEIIGNLMTLNFGYVHPISSDIVVDYCVYGYFDLS